MFGIWILVFYSTFDVGRSTFIFQILEDALIAKVCYNYQFMGILHIGIKVVYTLFILYFGSEI